MAFTLKEKEYIEKNRNKLPKDIATKLGVTIKSVREYLVSLETQEVANPEPVADEPPKELNERSRLIEDMKGRYEGSLVMTPMVSERGDDFAKSKKTYVPEKFNTYVGKIFKDKPKPGNQI